MSQEGSIYQQDYPQTLSCTYKAPLNGPSFTVESQKSKYNDRNNDRKEHTNMLLPLQLSVSPGNFGFFSSGFHDI